MALGPEDFIRAVPRLCALTQKPQGQRAGPSDVACPRTAGDAPAPREEIRLAAAQAAIKRGDHADRDVDTGVDRLVPNGLGLVAHFFPVDLWLDLRLELLPVSLRVAVCIFPVGHLVTPCLRVAAFD